MLRTAAHPEKVDVPNLTPTILPCIIPDQPCRAPKPNLAAYLQIERT